MELDRSTRVLKTPLILWARTFAATALADITDLADGYSLNKIMTEIDPNFFGMTFVHSSVYADMSLRVHNLEHLFRSLKNFYQEKLQQVIVMDTPDVFVMANNPESDESIEELNKILLLILGCAVQCERKEYFIEKIKTMDERLQEELVVYIREITENTDKVFAFQPSEVAALSHEDLLSYCEHMYDHLLLLVNQRDSNAEEIHQLLADRSFMSSKEVNGNISRVSSPPLSPTNSEFVQAEKAKLRRATEELEEKNLLIQEMRDELESNKVTLEKLLQENKSLSETSRFVNAYRDQLDVLKIKAEKVNKLENEILKYKEKLMEMDVLKKRKEELEEQNEILFNTKVVLEKQINTLNLKADKLVETEREVKRLKKALEDAIEDKKALQTRNRYLLDENASILLDAQNSLSEVSSLNSELNMMKDKGETGEGTCLANEYNQISSTKLLKLENENHHLKVLIAELTQHKSTAVPQAIVSEEHFQNVPYEQTTEHVEGVSEEPEVRVVERQSSIRKTLHAKESALNVVREKLKQKEELASKISESLSIMEQENNELQDRIQQVMNQKRRSDQLIERKNEDVTELERRLEEVTAERQKCEATLRQKSREINDLTNSLTELNEEKERLVEAAEKKTKDLNELKEKMDVLLTEKEKLRDNLTTSDKKLVDLENRLQRVREANKELVGTLESQRDKIASQERRVAELMTSAKEEERKQSETIREKDRRLKEFERRIGHLIEVETKLETLNSQLKQKDRKSDGFLKTIEEKDKEIVKLENGLADSKSTNNKLVHNLELREKKVDSLEQRLQKVESNDDRTRREILETKDNKILELESRLEDALTNCKKLHHTLKVKDEKIISLESRFEEAQVFELECSKMTNSLDEKKKRIAQLESSLDEVSGTSHKLSCDLQLKETKVEDLKERVRGLESERQEDERLRRTLQEKEDSAAFLSEKKQACEEELAVLKNRIEEANGQNRKLQHCVKIKEERICNLETSVLELEEVTSHNQKMKQIIEQKEEKIRAMEQKVDEFDEASRQCERLTLKLTDQEERVTVLNDRVSELEGHENNNKRLKLMVTQKDDRIKHLEQSLQDTQLKCTNFENEIAKVHSKYEEKVKRSLEDVDTHKIRRIESVRRREEQIKSLEKSRSKLETVLHAQEGHIQSLQDRLEGSVSDRSKLGSSISKKETMINQLQTKILELEESTGETKKLNEVVKKKDETIKRFEDRVREVELVLARTKTSSREKDEKIDALQKRIDECAEQSKKVDIRLKKKEEALLKTERNILKVENREKELENLLERKSQSLEERNSRILKLEALVDERNKEVSSLKINDNLVVKQVEESSLQSPRNLSTIDTSKVQTLKQKLWDAEARIEESENEKGKLQHKIKRKESQIQDLEQRLQESSDALEENERLKQSIKHKEERVRILQVSLDQNQQEINSLESRLESTTSEVYKLRKVDGEKQKRINSFKMKLEGTDQGANQIVIQKDEKIHSLEVKNGVLEQENNYLNKSLSSLEAELEKIREKKGSAETMIVNTSPRHRPDVACVTIDDAGNLETKYEDLERECEKLRLNKERTEGRYTSLKEENKSLTQEVEAVQSDYDQLLSDLNELKDNYTELDLSSAKSLHRCEMLTQMNSTLEEENRMLMEQMNKLLTQNQELLTESLVSRDQFLEEERTFSDRLYELQRQKEKLEEKIEQANKSLAENTPKKKSNLFKKVLQKAGLKKKKDEGLRSKSAVQLIKYDQSPNGTEGSSDMSVDSGPGIHGIFSMSPERGSDTSKFSESVNSDNSPDRDLSPLARRRARVNRAHRQRIVRSEYFTPAMANSLAIQGRSRSLDAKEFVREAIQSQEAGASPAQISSSNSMTILHGSSPSISEDLARERKHSHEVNRTLSFSLPRDESVRLSPAHTRRKNDKNKVSKPPEYKPAETNGDNSPLIRKKMVNTKVEEEKSVSTEVEVDHVTPELPIWFERSSRGSHHEDSTSSSRRVSDSSRMSSDMCSLHSRTSSCTEASSDPSKTTVRHVGSTPSASGEKVEQMHGVNGGLDTGLGGELQRLSSGSSGSSGHERPQRFSRHYSPTPPPPNTRLPGSSDTLAKDPPSLHDRLKEKPQTRRSNSCAERPQSPLLARNQIQRQNSDRVLVSSVEIERRNVSHTKPIPSVTASEKPRRPLSVGQRPSLSDAVQTSQTSGQSIGIVSFTEVPRMQSAILESSPQLERKNPAGIEEKKSDLKLKETASRGPQTPKSLKRASKVQNLAPKHERSEEKDSVWLEYGQI